VNGRPNRSDLDTLKTGLSRRQIGGKSATRGPMSPTRTPESFSIAPVCLPRTKSPSRPSHGHMVRSHHIAGWRIDLTERSIFGLFGARFFQSPFAALMTARWFHGQQLVGPGRWSVHLAFRHIRKILASEVRLIDSRRQNRRVCNQRINPVVNGNRTTAPISDTIADHHHCEYP
jgi:hypothetical protein